MNFVKKIIFGGILTTTIIPATILLSSCASDGSEVFDLGISDQTKEYYGQKIATKLLNNPDSIRRKTMLITAGGGVDDKSFIQSTWGALQLYKSQLEIASDDDLITYRETRDDSLLSNYYSESINKGYKTLVLTGFQQSEKFKHWLDTGNNKVDFIESKAIVIGVDWNGESFIPEGQFLGLGFKTEEPSWVVGYAAADYLTTSNITPHLSSFGGSPYDGITDFNNGFLQGMLDWNKNNPQKPVKFYSGNEQASSINLSTGFESTSDIMDVVDNIVGTNENAPQIILPVAGALTSTTLDNIRNKNSQQMIIGVDTNQSLAFPNDKDIFFSSIEKKIAVAVYKALVLLSGIPLDNTDGNISDIGFEGLFVANKISAYVKYGFDKGLVSYSPSTIINKIMVDNLLKDAMTKFDTIKPKFISMIDPSKNQEILDGIILEINK